MKKKALFLALCMAVLALMFPIIASAEDTSGQCGDNLYWSFDESTGALTITGSGAMEDYFFPSPWDEYNEQITSISLPSGLTNIGLGAFKNCTKIPSVSIPSSVTTIGQAAFEGCTSLKSVSIPNGVTEIHNGAFAECSSLTSVTIPNSVTTLGTYTEDEYYFGWDVFSECTSLRSVSIGSGIRELKGFEGCSALTSITIPNTVTSIGRCAFYGTGLTSVTIPGSVKKIGNSAFANCERLKNVTIPNSVTTIEKGAFNDTGITSITIPSSVTSIGDYAFNYCIWLTSVTLPNTISSIGYSTFSYCPNLKTISIPGSVKSIGKEAFRKCTGLQSITIPNGLTSIGENAFEDCTALESITIPNSVTSIGTWAFCGCTGLTSASIGNGITIIDAGVFSGCSSLQSISIPSSVKTIGFRAFQECSSLIAVTIPSSVTLINDVAFGYCSSLASVSIPNSVTTIGVSAFRDCVSLTSVKLPDNIDCIAVQAFYDCEKLSSIVIPNSVKSIDDRAFKYCSSLKSITLPDWLEIGDEAFTGCSHLTDVYYLSSENDKHIVLESGNECLSSATWHYFPEITSQPTSVTVPEGNKATFSITATDAESYQWQYQKPGETKWNNVSTNGIEASYSIITAARHNGYTYRCRVKNAAGTTYSSVATLTVNPLPVITTQPKSVTVNEGKTATFKVVATGADSYKWQYQKPGESTWNDVKNNGTDPTYSLTTVARHNGYKYRCKVTNANGSVNSNTVTLTVMNPKPVITTRPASVTVNEGKTATFKVVATGATGYQWQYQKPGESTWTNVSKNGTSATYSLTTAARHNGYKYRCKVTNAVGSVYTNTVTLTVKIKPVITTQPANVTVNEGKTATFKVVATGATSYQWQYQKPGTSTWTDVSNNGTSASYSLTTAARHNGYKYRCKVTNVAGSVNSNTVTLTVKPLPVITTQPKAVSVTAGAKATFKVVADGATKYQWQYQKPGDTTWTNVSTNGTSATYTLTTAARHNDYKYRCKVTNAAGSVYTNVVTLTVKS